MFGSRKSNMTPQDLVALRKSLELAQAGMADITGMSLRAYQALDSANCQSVPSTSSRWSGQPRRLLSQPRSRCWRRRQCDETRWNWPNCCYTATLSNQLPNLSSWRSKSIAKVTWSHATCQVSRFRPRLKQKIWLDARRNPSGQAATMTNTGIGGRETSEIATTVFLLNRIDLSRASCATVPDISRACR